MGKRCAGIRSEALAAWVGFVSRKPAPQQLAALQHDAATL
jgi:hypothetical protein